MSTTTPKAVILGCAGESLTAAEKQFFAQHNPYGFILFARNCINPEQVKKLTNELRECVGRKHLCILIDQEGGRVARLKPPHWRAAPSAASLSLLSQNEKAIYLNARLIASELAGLGITVNCAPLADIPVEGSHEIIGDRAYGTTPSQVSTLAREMARGLADGGVLPVLKHIPGHGRARVDSHEDLPVVTESLAELEQSDFIPFQQLRDLPLGMTAHIIYTALDADRPATLSPVVIDYIRNKIGFDGLLMSDDLSMKALKGDFAQLTRDTLKAGCDLVLHCNGKMEEMTPIAEAALPLTSEAIRRDKRMWAEYKPAAEFDVASAEARLAELSNRAVA